MHCFLYSCLVWCLHCYAHALSSADEESVHSRDTRFRNQILTTGATKDRIAAHILKLTEAPLHSLQHFEKLVNFIHSNKDSHLREMASKNDHSYSKCWSELLAWLLGLLFILCFFFVVLFLLFLCVVVFMITLLRESYFLYSNWICFLNCKAVF